MRLVGDLQTELVEDFFGGFVNHAGANLHAKVLYGRSNHHKIEAIFKCFARAMKYACSKDARLKDQLPSTKGLLMIAIFDYGAGNLRSVQNTLGEIGCEYTLVRDADGLRAATKIMLPGVGHFGQMMRALDALGVRETLIERIAAGVPFLGICLGMQALFESSEEAPEVRGLGIFPGTVQRFPDRRARPAHGLERIGSRARLEADPRSARAPLRLLRPQLLRPGEPAAPAPPALTSCTYTAVLESGNVYGVQFHPEKSGPPWDCDDRQELLVGHSAC